MEIGFDIGQIESYEEVVEPVVYDLSINDNKLSKVDFPDPEGPQTTILSPN